MLGSRRKGSFGKCSDGGRERRELDFAQEHVLSDFERWSVRNLFSTFGFKFHCYLGFKRFKSQYLKSSVPLCGDVSSVLASE